MHALLLLAVYLTINMRKDIQEQDITGEHNMLTIFKHSVKKEHCNFSS